MKNTTYDLIIVGGGPAGLTAAIYATRSNLKTLVLEKEVCGGQIFKTARIDNYPGLMEVSGAEFSKNLEEQAEKLGAEIKFEEVESFEKKSNVEFIVKTDEDEYAARAIILATGLIPRKLNIPGEEEFENRGVSYCAVCDGGFYKDKEVAVVGGGNSALSSTEYLADICKKVYLIHRREEFRAVESLQKRVLARENVEPVLNAELEEISGNQNVEKIIIEKDDSEIELNVDAVFMSAGQMSQGAELNAALEVDSQGFLLCDNNLQTSIEGVFLAGDNRVKGLRQLTTAVADGSIAATNASEYIKRNR